MTQRKRTTKHSQQEAATVFFAAARARGAKENKIAKIAALFARAGFGSCIPQGALTAIKVHVGERGNDTFMNPVFVRRVVDCVKKAGGKPFLTDTNTLYKGSRHNAVDHMTTAIEHGFDYAVVGAPFLVADGLQGGSFEKVSIRKKHFSSVKIASAVAQAGAMIVLSHFKGHELAGFGGAIKNLAMGCTPSQGKHDQHASRFEVDAKQCIGCRRCAGSCPESAIAFVASGSSAVAVIDKKRCVGCGECLTVCPTKAVSIDWATEIVPFNERMVEYAYGVVASKRQHVGYINFLLNVTPDCDCVPWSDAPLVQDIGILASTDPVALDTASYDLVNRAVGCADSLLHCGHAAGEDKFSGTWRHTRGDVQLSYAERIGLGSRRYELVSV